jgi:hypothetical protein
MSFTITMVAVGAFVAAVGSLVVSAGHFVIRRGHETGSTSAKVAGTMMSVVLGAAFDCVATATAPRAVVSSMGALVVVWNALIAWRFLKVRPSRAVVLRATSVAVGVAMVARSGPPENGDDAEVSPLLFSYASACVLLLMDRLTPERVGALGGCAGPFLKAAMLGGVSYWPVVLSVAGTHAWLLSDALCTAPATTVIPPHTAAIVLSGVAASFAAFGVLPTRPIEFLVGLGFVGAGLFADPLDGAPRL